MRSLGIIPSNDPVPAHFERLPLNPCFPHIWWALQVLYRRLAENCDPVPESQPIPGCVYGGTCAAGCRPEVDISSLLCAARVTARHSGQGAPAQATAAFLNVHGDYSSTPLSHQGLV